MKSFSKIIQSLNSPKEPKTVDIVSIISKNLRIPSNVVRKGINQQLLTINNKIVMAKHIYILDGSIVKFQNQIISIEKDEDIKSSYFDRFISEVIDELGIANLENIKSDSKSAFCSYLIEYFCNYHYESFSAGSESFELVYSELELFYREHFKDSKEIKVPKRKELTEGFIKRRTDKIRLLNVLKDNLLNGTFNSSLYKFLQEYNKIVTQPDFVHCIAPLLPSTLYSKVAMESLIKPITDSFTHLEIDHKYQHFENYKNIYISQLRDIDASSELQLNIFLPIVEYLFSLLKTQCETLEAKNAKLSVNKTSRKYNFDNFERNEFDLLFTVKNVGEGLGREILIESLTENFKFCVYKLGVLKPLEEVNISIPAEIVVDETFLPVIKLRCSWKDNSADVKFLIFELEFEIQTKDVPWFDLEKSKPYTIQEIEDKDKLYGRDEILRELENNVRSSKIESYKIWGQKRVGKSSIVKTLKSLFIDNEKIIVVWRSIAGLKNTNPIETLNTLGESICVEIFEEIDSKIKNPIDRERLRIIEVPNFNGSLFPLENYIKKLKRNDTSLKFIIILDEFDRINEEFFLPGVLGDTFSLNVGKGISTHKDVGFILVGSENMHLLDRQEINYNSFLGREIDTFDKRTEYSSFKNIVIGPVAPYINYSLEAIDLIFTITNGNPYFANLICSNVFKLCLKLKDNEVDTTTVNTAIDFIVDSTQKSHFEHFWGDGITDESSVKKEKKTDIRRRVLVSYSFVYFQKKEFPTRNEIVRSFKKPSEYTVENYEIENTINEFFSRKIFYENSTSCIRIKPEIFEKWLCGPGRTLMIEGVSDLEALQREKQLEAEHSLKQAEFSRLSRNLKFKGKEVPITDFITFFNQFGGPLEQRRIFKILDSLYYLSQEEIQDFFKREQKNIFKTSVIEMKLGAKTPFRENVEIYSFQDTLDDNESIIETFKLLSHIRNTKTVKNLKNGKEIWKQNSAEDIIIFDSIIDDFSNISPELVSFLEDPVIRDKAVVKLVVLIITSKAKADLIKATSTFKNFKFVPFKEVKENIIKPFVETTEIFETADESSYAFSEVKKQFPAVNKEVLNILFESHCSSKSIPILWFKTMSFKPLFPNDKATTKVLSDQHNKEDLRTRLYHSNTNLSQKLNKFIVSYLKAKANSEGKPNWLIVDYIPAKQLLEITNRWIEEGQKLPIESYFNFIHYKEILKKNKEITVKFQLGSDGLNWCEKLNVLRRDPAHPEKPAPKLEDVVYFENTTEELLKRIHQIESSVTFKIEET